MSGAQASPLIELANVSKRYGDQLAVDRLSFEVRHGEIVALLGKTGAGKSTVMNMLMGTIGCDEGGVRVAGVDPFREFRALKGKLSVSFQTDRLLPWRTALDNAALGLQILGRPRAEARQIARQWLARVKLEGEEDKYVHELSGGMRQRVSLARALAVDPEIVLLDEWHAGTYGIPDAKTIEAIRLCARLEGVLTDPVYEGKSMAGLIGMIRSGEIPPGSRVLYAHLGGQPALSAYAHTPGLGG